MSQRTTDTTDSGTSAQPSGTGTSATSGISLVSPGSGGQLTLNTPTVPDVGPRFSEWLPTLNEALLPTLVRTVRKLAFQYDSRLLDEQRPRLFAHECLHRKHGVGTPVGAYRPVHPFNDAISKYAISYFNVDPDELSDRKRDVYEYARNEIVGVGTHDASGGPNGLDAVRETIIPLLNASEHTPTIILFLDGPAWEDVTDERTAARALDTIAAFGEVCDIRLVCSPRLEARLERNHPDWYDDHLRLTDSRNQSRPPAPDETNETGLAAAWDTVGSFTPGGGRLRLLAALSAEYEREVRDLKRDSEIGLSDGAIDRYVREFADDYDLVEIDDRPKYNRVSLTSCGSAAQSLIGPDYRTLHPEQSRFDSGLTGTPHDATSVVCCPDAEDSPPQPAGGGDDVEASSPSRSLPAAVPSAEDWLATTGAASENGYTQWLNGPDGRLDAWEMHERLLAGQRAEGVTLVDEPVQEFEDGKVTYISCFEDHAQVVAQWGGPLCTLVRITSGLLSEKMWSKVLTLSAVGENLEELYDGALDDAIQDVVRLGAQIGWFGEDEHSYDGLRDRLSGVRRLILSKLSELKGSDTGDEWSDLCRDVHGLLASATHLYHAIGVDVSINIRVPDTQKLRAGEKRYNGFLKFFKHTVPKNAVYGVHSVYRLLHEERVDKLKHRMGVEFGDDPAADLTASWVISGPTATTFRDDVEQAIASKAADVRDRIKNGDERGVSLSIPVVEGNSYGALRQMVDRHTDRKGFDGTKTDDYRKIIRLSAATLGEQPGRCSPYALAEALLSIAKARSPTAALTTSDVAHGLAQLPAERLLPSLPPTMQQALKALLVADEPLGRSAIIDRAGISESSYDRNINELSALGMVESVGNGGHRKWGAWIIPYWSPLADVDQPRTADIDDETVLLTSRWDDVLYEIVLDLGLEHNYELFAWSVDFDEVLDALPILDRWRAFIGTHYGLKPTEVDSDKPQITDRHLAEIATAGVEPDQASLATTTGDG